MSAVNSNSSDRETEAIRRAQRAHEPSMDEILASIRTIIAEEQSHDKAREPDKAAAPKSAPRAVAPLAGPQIVYSKGDAAAPRSAPETIEPPDAPPAPEADSPKVVRRKQEAAALGRAGARLRGQRRAAAVGGRRRGGDVVVRGSVGQPRRALRRNRRRAWRARCCARCSRLGSTRTCRAIVERLVRAEIQRVARGIALERTLRLPFR